MDPKEQKLLLQSVRSSLLTVRHFVKHAPRAFELRTVRIDL